jgi:hypothetical protein
METLRNNFEKKYGIDAIKLVKEASFDAFGTLKTIGINGALKSYVEKNGYEFKIDDDFGADLIEVMAEEQERFPENQKFQFEFRTEIRELTAKPINPSIPKSKGVLEDFKDIVADDDFRPRLNGVYVTENGFLVATDAHKLVKYKNDDFSQYAGKIINLEKYIGTKGAKIDFIDEKYPDYQVVIPEENPNNVKGLSTYAFYNFCKSAINIKKLQNRDIFRIEFSYGEETYYFNPILFSELLAFALCKGFNTFDLSFSTPNRAFVLNFGKESLGLIMPLFEKDYDFLGLVPLTFEQVEEMYKGGDKVKSAPKSSTKPTQTAKEPQFEPYKKYQGKVSDSKYIPRREIKSITLVSGEVLGTNDIIDGIYRTTKKFATGGVLKTGVTYIGEDGQSYRYVGKSEKNDGMGIFIKDGRYVELSLSDFSVSKKTGMFGFFEDGGQVFSNDKFIAYIYPKVYEIGRENGLVINEDLSISEGGTKFYTPNIMRMNDGDELDEVSVYYMDEDENIVGIISFDAEDNELEMEFPMWELNVETEI